MSSPAMTIKLPPEAQAAVLASATAIFIAECRRHGGNLIGDDVDKGLDAAVIVAAKAWKKVAHAQI